MHAANALRIVSIIVVAKAVLIGLVYWRRAETVVSVNTSVRIVGLARPRLGHNSFGPHQHPPRYLTQTRSVSTPHRGQVEASKMAVAGKGAVQLA